MKHLDDLAIHLALLQHLKEVPKKIVNVHGQDNVQAMVLHDLCHESCFNLNKAAYFVDNPDFNCFKGIAGICKHEEGYCKETSNIWEESDKYCSYLQNSSFNNKVCSFEEQSMQNGSQEDLINKIALELEIEDPQYLVWPMKHDNFGVLIYQNNDGDKELIEEHLGHGVYLLSFCPVH